MKKNQKVEKFQSINFDEYSKELFDRPRFT